MPTMKAPAQLLLLGVSLVLLATSAYGQDCVNDNVNPACFIFGSQTHNQITVQTTDSSGICGIIATRTENVNVPGLPFSSTPANAPLVVLVTATKQDPSQKARFELKVTDCCGRMRTCDPILTSVLRTQGKPLTDTFFEIPQEEGFVRISNGNPGLRKVEVIVNGRKFQVPGLADGEVRTLDVTAAMEPGLQNMMSLVGYGKPGGSAAVLIWDGN